MARKVATAHAPSLSGEVVERLEDGWALLSCPWTGWARVEPGVAYVDEDDLPVPFGDPDAAHWIVPGSSHVH